MILWINKCYPSNTTSSLLKACDLYFVWSEQLQTTGKHLKASAQNLSGPAFSQKSLVENIILETI